MKQQPKIGFGTWLIQGEDVYPSIKAALEAGYKHFDTAQIYNNEYQIGEAFKKMNVDFDDLFITSKIWPSNYRNYTYTSLKESLQRLGVKKINLMLLHNGILGTNEDIVHAYKELMKAREEKLIDYVGVSNFTIEQLELIKEKTGEYPHNNQIISSPTTRLEQVEKFCKEKGITLTAYSTLKSYFNPNPFYPGSGMSDKQKEYIDSLAQKYGKNQGQILNKWALQMGYLIIPKSTKVERIKINLDLEGFELAKEEMDELVSWNTYSSKKMVETFGAGMKKRVSEIGTLDDVMEKGLLFEKNF